MRLDPVTYFPAAPCSSSRGLHFWEVVDLDTLLQAMVEDTAPEVVSKLHRLLLPSYYPGPEEGTVSGRSNDLTCP